jgi:hypothetical protein
MTMIFSPAHKEAHRTRTVKAAPTDIMTGANGKTCGRLQITDDRIDHVFMFHPRVSLNYNPHPYAQDAGRVSRDPLGNNGATSEKGARSSEVTRRKTRIGKRLINTIVRSAPIATKEDKDQ